MDIEIDAGNTRLKWRLRDESGVSATSVASSPSEIAEAIASRAVSVGAADSQAPIGRVRIASVRSPDALADFVAECRDLFSLDPQVARVVQGHAGVIIRYPDTSRLGVDRWLAMLAANAASSKACLVVDCGTALTVDKLNALGEHCGGYILPGLALMRRSLEENTRIRLDVGFEVGGLSLGHSTDEAVYHGSLAAAVALIVTTLEDASAWGGECELLVTGGGAVELMPHLLGRGARLVPDLVLEGLSLAF